MCVCVFVVELVLILFGRFVLKSRISNENKLQHREESEYITIKVKYISSAIRSPFRICLLCCLYVLDQHIYDMRF